MHISLYESHKDSEERINKHAKFYLFKTRTNSEHFKLITRDRLIQIGLDLLVLCHHPKSTIPHPLYYLTCMLPVNKETVGERDNCVYFMTTGFVLPIGLGRATITGIVQQRMKTKTQWTVDYDTFYRNSLEFTVGSPATSFKISCSTKNPCETMKSNPINSFIFLRSK